MPPCPIHGLVVSPCVHNYPAFLQRCFPHDLLPHVPSCCLPTVNTRLNPGIALQFLHFISPLLWTPRDLCSHLGYIGLQLGLFVWFSFHSDCHRSAAALCHSLRLFFSAPNNCPVWGSEPFFSPPTPWVKVHSFSLFFPSFFHPTKFYVDLYIPFWWSGTSAHTQLVFCEIFCIWRCTPDASVEGCSPHPPTPPPSCLLKYASFWCDNPFLRNLT